MTDGQWLFIVFLCLYLLECVRWRQLAARMFHGGGPEGGWSLRAALPQIQSQQRGLFLLPLWPADVHLMTLPWIAVPSPQGLVLRDRAETSSNLKWEEVKPVIEGVNVRLNRHILLPMPDAVSAGQWCERLKSWRDMSDEESRRDFIEHAKDTLDTDKTSKLAREIERATGGLRLLGVTILMWCFGVVSVVYRWRGDGWEVMAAALALLALQITQAVYFLRVTREARWAVPHRRWKALAIAFLPHLSARAADHVCESTASQLRHPLSCRRLLKAAEWTRHASCIWRETRYRQGGNAMDNDDAEVHVLEIFFEKEGCALSDITPAPARQVDAETYCPRCESQFLSGHQVCRDCGGIALIRFGK